VTDATPVVAEVVRSGFVESRHRGHVVALAADGSTTVAIGDVDAPMLPRSSLKPLQALALLRAGWCPHDDRHVALAAASHSGEDEHVAVVRRMLADAELHESALQNTPDQPLDTAAARERIRAGAGPDRLRQNCSGKHAAMLATCVANGWPVDSYLAPEHPVQQAIRAEIERLTGGPIEAVVVDGCGAPMFAISLVGLARAFAFLVDTEVAAAMRAHPHLVGGSGRDVTTLMTALPGLIAKDGAEGVYAAALADGRAIAVKVEDGSGRARTPVLVRTLEACGVDVRPVGDLATGTVLGHGEPVGVVRATGIGAPHG
jgi:L-asparaginase II